MTETQGHLFLSYAAEDRERVRAIAVALANEGWRVWWDRENLPPGKKFHRIIDEAIQASACVLVFWSQDSVDSDWVIDEATEGKRLGKLLPVLLDASRPPYGFRSYHYLDLSAWDGAALDANYRRLAEALTVYAPGPAAGGSGEAERWLTEIANPDTEPERRLEIGDELARLGDPRKGIGLDESGLPDIDWVEIPAGPFLYGEDKERCELPTFFIARLPITNAQYQVFIDDGGYEDARWWEGLADHPDPQEPRWSATNRPRETVSWYEAMAFCRWLSDRQAYEVRLPTELEWEKAARGEDGREYPWGDGYRSGFANVDETLVEAGPTDLGQTTAVGLYPHTASPYGVEDLAGNVWEWCLNEYGNPDRTEPGGDVPRALRGGSWDFNPELARASGRDGSDPGNSNNNIGFRVMCSSPMPR